MTRQKHPVILALLMMGFLYSAQLVIWSAPHWGALFTWSITTSILLFIMSVLSMLPIKKPALVTPITPKTSKLRHIIYIPILTMGMVSLYDICIGQTPLIICQMSLPNIILLCIITPICEELIYREWLYGQWARQRLGVSVGILTIGTLFVLTHGTTTLLLFMLYWIPTLYFYVTYEYVGRNVYTVIAIHIMYNYLTLSTSL